MKFDRLCPLKNKNTRGAEIAYRALCMVFLETIRLLHPVFKLQVRYPSDVEHRLIKYLNNVSKCDHSKLKRIINPMLGFKSIKTAYATINGIEVMRALRKDQASAFYYVDFLGEMRLVSRVFEM